MRYRKTAIVALVLMLQACGMSSTKALDDNKIVKESTAVSSGSNDRATSKPPIGQSNLSPDRAKEVKVDTQINAALPQSCATEEYKSFFEQFVRGKDNPGNDIRYIYTSPYVQVRDYQDPSKLLEVMSRKNDEFSIDLRDYKWVQLVPSQVDNSPYTRLKIDIQKVNEKTFRVDYIKAQYRYAGTDKDLEETLVKTYGEPNAYIFEHRNGCWNLTQKLQSQPSLRSQIDSSEASVAAILTKQMAYADLRSALLKNNWLPTSNPNCKNNVGGKAPICGEIPELEVCSGDGYCLMSFTNQANSSKLTITTYGDYRDWNITGRESRLQVTQWQFGKL
ncbi:MAG: hypothetical protein DCF19_09720 [Pseudanabaena frigida]|uniref:Lipoprotein n=1 Tax=Pseudanabaena frigida TaxID=945775 RepID=A0A2W4Y1R3_9CYAN|nr:MAG: hypothetical protein DCF19_09720 [Pseudanabaena frigida]